MDFYRWWALTRSLLATKDIKHLVKNTLKFKSQSDPWYHKLRDYSFCCLQLITQVEQPWAPDCNTPQCITAEWPGHLLSLAPLGALDWFMGRQWQGHSPGGSKETSGTVVLSKFQDGSTSQILEQAMPSCPCNPWPGFSAVLCLHFVHTIQISGGGHDALTPLELRWFFCLIFKLI